MSIVTRGSTPKVTSPSPSVVLLSDKTHPRSISSFDSTESIKDALSAASACSLLSCHVDTPTHYPMGYKEGEELKLTSVSVLPDATNPEVDSTAKTKRTFHSFKRSLLADHATSDLATRDHFISDRMPYTPLRQPLFEAKEKKSQDAVCSLAAYMQGSYSRVLSEKQATSLVGTGYFESDFLQDSLFLLGPFKNNPKLSAYQLRRLSSLEAQILRSLHFARLVEKGSSFKLDDYVKQAIEQLQRLKQGHRFSLGHVSLTTDHDSHLTLLYFEKLDARSVRLHFINLGHGYLPAKEDIDCCADLVLSLEIDAKLTSFLTELYSKERITSELYPLFYKHWPSTKAVSTNYEAIIRPLCVRASYFRVFREQLGVALFGEFLSFWTAKEMETLEAKHHLTGKLPEHKGLISVPMSTLKSHRSHPGSSAEMPTEMQYQKHIEGLALTYIEHQKSTRKKTLSLDSLPTALARKIKSESKLEADTEGWHLVIKGPYPNYLPEKH